MNLTKDIEIIDLALYVKKQKILIIADTHIGYEEALNKQGILIPRFHFKELIKRIEKLMVLSLLEVFGFTLTRFLLRGPRNSSH